jgi:hypothetical protein
MIFRRDAAVPASSSPIRGCPAPAYIRTLCRSLCRLLLQTPKCRRYCPTRSLKGGRGGSLLVLLHRQRRRAKVTIGGELGGLATILSSGRCAAELACRSDRHEDQSSGQGSRRERLHQ